MSRSSASWAGPYPGRRRGRVDVLASDAEREQTASELRAHYAAGRLDHGELERRVERAYRASSRGQLRSVMADLPSPLSGRLGSRFYRLQRELLSYHMGAYATINGALTTVWVATGEGRFWPAGVLAPTTVLVVCHAFGSRWLGTRLRRPRWDV